MRGNACQYKIIKSILLNRGYISRSRMLDRKISRLSKYINDLRNEGYIIDTIRYKKRVNRIFRNKNWGSCIYILKCHSNGNWNENYNKQTEYFIKTNKLKNSKYYTNDYQEENKTILSR
ncbi:MAG: hypothetical protein EOL97_14080 [Spirochaetia bacterium]|nr:hypothetical protein [Spirochaetia bacterium]